MEELVLFALHGRAEDLRHIQIQLKPHPRLFSSLCSVNHSCYCWQTINLQKNIHQLWDPALHGRAILGVLFRTFLGTRDIFWQHLFTFEANYQPQTKIRTARKKWEKCAPCTTWKSKLIFCLCFQVPMTFFHNLLKSHGHNSKSKLRTARYVPSDPKITK